MSLNDTLANLATGYYTVTRSAPHTLALGRVVPGATSTFNIQASVQPLIGSGRRSGGILKVMPEGTHKEEVRAIFTTAPLLIKHDVVTIDGEPWKVFENAKWEGLGTTHYEAFATRQVIP